MNKKLLFAAAAIALLAASCGKKAAVQSSASVSTQQTQNQSASGQTSLKALMASGTPQKCQVNFSESGNTTQGTIYVTAGKMRGDFVSQADGKTATSHMINDSQNIYTWMDGAPMGMKMSVQAMQSMQSATSTSQHQTVDPNADYNYQCSPWAGDSSEFTAPSSVNFSSMMNMQAGSEGTMQTNGGVQAQGSASMKAQECAACDNAGSGKAQCMAALGCSQ